MWFYCLLTISALPLAQGQHAQCQDSPTKVDISPRRISHLWKAFQDECGGGHSNYNLKNLNYSAQLECILLDKWAKNDPEVEYKWGRGVYEIT
ncbi:unnamed protein product [Cylicocyclus nassatus]|uniref:Uncharacterized protein n=1 Tax=Cylicocyclus nassatus TaxID=53992 RepID=A0AA36DPP6_CYLNA|nr:unnamed protein product [Cylicocyclus nassatus]